MRSGGKLETLHFYCHNVYGHQTRQDGNIPWGTPIHIDSHRMTRRWSGIVTSCYKLNTYFCLQKTYGHQIMQVADLLRLRPLKSHDPLIMWQFEKFISPLSQDFWPLNLAGWWLWGGGSSREVITKFLLYILLFHITFPHIEFTAPLPPCLTICL